MASPLASVQKYISTSLPQTVLTPTQNGLPVFLKEDLFGKVFPTNCLFKATLEHCCDITIIHFGLHPTISKLRIFLLLWLNWWDLLYCQGMSLGNGISTSVVEFAINTLCIFSSTNISHALLFARSYGASNRASCTSAYNLQKALSPSNITRIDWLLWYPQWAGAIYQCVEYVDSRIQSAYLSWTFFYMTGD